MKCKYCGMDNLHWPENYTKGCRPLEEDTNVEHTWDRCNELRSPNKEVKKPKGIKPPYPNKTGWIKIKCDICQNQMMLSKKWYKDPITSITCRDCTHEKFNKLDNFDITL